MSWVYPGSRLCVSVPFLVHEGRCVPAIAGLSPSVLRALVCPGYSQAPAFVLFYIFWVQGGIACVGVSWL